MTKKLSAKITDFGSMSSKLNAISHDKDDDLVEETSLLGAGEKLMYDAQTMAGTVGASMTQGIGTPLYMAPEVIDMAHTKFTLKTDVFSFGVLMWEILSYGVLPFEEVQNIDVKAKVKEGLRLKQCV